MTESPTTPVRGWVSQQISQRLAWIALVTATIALLVSTTVDGYLETAGVVALFVGIILLVTGLAVRLLELRE